MAFRSIYRAAFGGVKPQKSDLHHEVVRKFLDDEASESENMSSEGETLNRIRGEDVALSDTGSDALDASSDDDSDLSDFVVSDSASEGELRRGARKPPQRIASVAATPRRLLRRSPVKRTQIFEDDSGDEVRVGASVSLDNVPIPGEDAASTRHNRNDETTCEHDKENVVSTPAGCGADIDVNDLSTRLDDALHLLLPTASQSSKPTCNGIAVDPSTSPSRAILKSPTKNRGNIPKSPHRPTVDAFWAQDNVDQWNDKHSPIKKLNLAEGLENLRISSGRNSLILGGIDSDFTSSDVDSRSLTPNLEPRAIQRPVRTPTRSPEKRSAKLSQSPTKMARDPEQRVFLESGRQELARHFLAKLNERMVLPAPWSCTVERKFSESGGIKLVWSKTLQKTAGRARVSRREAMIELAEKVLWTPYQVYNTLAHEFCHLLTMICTPKAQSHGAEFQTWARQIERTFPIPAPDVTISIARCHDYEIQFKYVWQCEKCGREIGRHSKSLPDNSFHRTDGGRFVQIKPTPRGMRQLPEGNISATPIAKSAWQTFREANYKLIQTTLAATLNRPPQMKEVMAELSARWKVEKSKQASGLMADEAGSEKELPNPSVQVIDLDADDESEGGGEIDVGGDGSRNSPFDLTSLGSALD